MLSAIYLLCDAKLHESSSKLISPVVSVPGIPVPNTAGYYENVCSKISSAFDSSGNLFVVASFCSQAYSTMQTWLIERRTDGSVTTTGLASDVTGPAWSDLVVDHNDVVHVVWSYGSQPVRYANSTNFSTVSTLSDQNCRIDAGALTGALARNANGAIGFIYHCEISGEGTCRLKYKSYTSDWSADENIGQPAPDCPGTLPSLFIDSNDHAHAVTKGMDPLMYYTNASGSWSTAVDAVNGAGVGADKRPVSLAVDGSGNVTVVFQNSTNALDYVQKLAGQGSFGAVTTLQDCGADGCTIGDLEVQGAPRRSNR